MKDIIYQADNYVFSYRVGGVLIHNGKILLQKVPNDDGYAFPGGHVTFGETTDVTLVREFKEELGADIQIVRLLMVGENFCPGVIAAWSVSRSICFIWFHSVMKHKFPWKGHSRRWTRWATSGSIWICVGFLLQSCPILGCTPLKQSNISSLRQRASHILYINKYGEMYKTALCRAGSLPYGV